MPDLRCRREARGPSRGFRSRPGGAWGWLPVLLAAVCMLGAASLANAQSGYPPRPVRLLVGFPPGGTTDVIARVLSLRLSEYFNMGFVVDNRPGATGTIAAELAAAAPPDGTILLVVSAAFASSVSLYPKLAYHPLRDFSPISRVASVHNVLVIHPSVPARTVRGLVDLAHRRPGDITFASAGNGSGSHLALELLRMMAGGMNVVHVPHRGMGPAVLDVLAGDVDALIAAMPVAIAHIRSGKLRALAVASPRRAQPLPEVPTFIEAGFVGYEATAWNGVLAPAGTPYDVIVRLNLAIVEIAKSPLIRKRLESLGAEVVADTPDQFGEFLRREIDMWGRVVKASRAKLD
jgi:tripartite-type tricarboxylate transporter receptor subunit TctC